MRRIHWAAVPLLGCLVLGCGRSGETEPVVASAAGIPGGSAGDSSATLEPLVTEGVASLHGRILLDDDLSPEGFSVSLYGISPEDGEPISEAMEFPGEDGAFTFSKVIPGRKRLVIDAEEPASADSPLTPRPALIGSVKQALALELGEVRTIEIDLRPHRPCAARVTVRTEREPAAGLNVLWQLPSEATGLIGITDEEGVAAGWCPPDAAVTILAGSRTGLTLEATDLPLGLTPREPVRLELQVAGGTLTVVLPEGLTLGENEQVRARLIPSGGDPASSTETLIWTEALFEALPWGRDQAYLLSGRACDLGLLPPGELRIEAVVDDPSGGSQGRPWPKNARRFEGKATIVTGMRTVVELR